jgi:enolase
MPILKSLHAIEILDSRGRPTIQATCTLASGILGTASVPSGASTGRAEALELRDGDPKRYRGLGCRKAVHNINETIQAAIQHQHFATQTALDTFLIALDGTPNKSRLGANALLAVSLAFARACAAQDNIPLYHYFADDYGETAATLPRLTVNLFSGGKHAGGQVAIQDVLLVPMSADSVQAGLAMLYDIYQAAAELMYEKYQMRLLKADEGGLAPPFPDDEAMLQEAVRAIERAGYTPGQDVALAIDVASSHFFQDGVYHLNGQQLDGAGMVAQIQKWVATYPLISVEDGLAEEDWTHWTQLANALPASILVLGDDLLCTHPARIQKAITEKAANALLLKVNQIGTLSEARQAAHLARQAGWQVVVSARSGETEDHWLADLAVGWHGDFIKVGSIQQSERLAKYNRLLMIEHETSFKMTAFPKSK